MSDQSFEYKRHWTEMHKELGLEAVREDVANTSLDHRKIGEVLIKELEEKEYKIEEHKMNIRRDEREEKTLAFASKAQQQAEKSYQQSWIAIGIAGLGAILTIVIAMVSN